jgi:hypothetical protein
MSNTYHPGTIVIEATFPPGAEKAKVSARGYISISVCRENPKTCNRQKKPKRRYRSCFETPYQTRTPSSLRTAKAMICELR